MPRTDAYQAVTEERLRRMEDKLNVLLTHAGIDYMPITKDHWQRLADEGNTLDAAKEYHTAQSVPLEEAKRVVEEYIADMKRH